MLNQVVRGPHLPVRTGGVDFRFRSRELMEEERSPPPIDEFAVAVDTQAGIRVDEADLLWIVTIERRGDLLVVANRIASEH